MTAALIIARHLDAASLDTRTQAAADACCAGAAALREADAETERLRGALRYQEDRDGRVGTHSDECWSFGPGHYECALREIARLQTAGAGRPARSAAECTCARPSTGGALRRCAVHGDSVTGAIQ